MLIYVFYTLEMLFSEQGKNKGDILRAQALPGLPQT